MSHKPNMAFLKAIYCTTQGRRNGSGRPGGCRTNNLTSKNFYVHFISISENVSWSRSRIYAIRRQILMLKCTKFDFRWGSAPDPLAGFKAPLLKGGRRKWREGEGWRVEEKNEGPTTTKGKRRKWIGGREGKRKGFAGPMSNCFLCPYYNST